MARYSELEKTRLEKLMSLSINLLDMRGKIGKVNEMIHELFGDEGGVKSYTSSTDDALSIIPKDCSLVLSSINGLSTCRVTSLKNLRTADSGKMPSLPMAICLAMVRYEEKCLYRLPT